MMETLDVAPGSRGHDAPGVAVIGFHTIGVDVTPGNETRQVANDVCREENNNNIKRDGVVKDGVGSTEETDNEEKVKFWCVSGCLTTVTLAILFFAALPAGALLCVYASTHADDELLAFGICLCLLPVLVLPLIVVILYNRRRLKRLRFRRTT